MIVQPDFADHWKTELAVKLSGSEAAVRCILRFWSHCQNRKKWTFEGMTPVTLAAICKWSGDAQLFWDAMAQTFLDANGTSVTAHEWEAVNSRLIHNWTVGPKGGRPSKTKDDEKTKGISQGLTDREDRLDREEKIDKKEREERIFFSLKEAIAFFEASGEFPDRPIKASLSDLVSKKGKEYLTEEYSRSWLTNDKRRKKTPPPIESNLAPAMPDQLTNGDAETMKGFEPGPEAAAEFARLRAGLVSKFSVSDEEAA